MGTLWTIQTTIHDDDTITPTCQGYEYNGVLFGEPVELDNNPLTFEFNDSAFPNGEVNIIDNQVVVTVAERETE